LANFSQKRVGLPVICLFKKAFVRGEA